MIAIRKCFFHVFASHEMQIANDRVDQLDPDKGEQQFLPSHK